MLRQWLRSLEGDDSEIREEIDRFNTSKKA